MTCSTSDCPSPVYARDLCRRCYNRNYAGARFHAHKTRNDVVNSFAVEFKIRARCKHDDDVSPRPNYARGLCRSCYDKQVRKAKKKGIIYSDRQKQEPLQTAERELPPGVIPELTQEEWNQLRAAAAAPPVTKPPTPRPVVSKEEGARQIATVIANLNGRKPPAPRVSQHPEDCDWSDD